MYQSTGTDSNSRAMATTTLDSASTVGAIAVVGWNINDVSACAPSSTSSEPASTSHTGAQTNPTSTSTSASAPTQTTSAAPDSGLSTNAKAGIGIGVALGAIGLAALIGAILIVRRWKRTAADNTTHPPRDIFPHRSGQQALSTATHRAAYGSMDKPPPASAPYYQSMEAPPTELDATAHSPR
jgi:hypothetical protein